jgi:HK97 family phage prohead protease
MPRITWAHDWSQPLGQYIAYDDKPDGLDLVGQFDDFNDVPMARQAYAQLKSGTIDQFSVGFMPLTYERDAESNRMTFTRGRLDEVALVLMGAVPGTKLLAMRSKIHVRSDLVLALDDANTVLLGFHSGELDLADALAEIKAQARPLEELDDNEEGEGEGGDEDGEGETDEPDMGGEGEETDDSTDDGEHTNPEGEPDPTTLAEGKPEPEGPSEAVTALLAQADEALALVDTLTAV